MDSRRHDEAIKSRVEGRTRKKKRRKKDRKKSRERKRRKKRLCGLAENVLVVSLEGPEMAERPPLLRRTKSADSS